MRAVSRRVILNAALVAPLAACGLGDQNNSLESNTRSAMGSSGPAGNDAFSNLENTYGARLGLYAFHTGTGASLAHRPEERFAFCSTFKALVVAAVLNHPVEFLDTRLTYGSTDILAHSPITEQHITDGMTVRELCDAAARFSDNTAATLLLQQVGGPAGLTDYVRSLGDDVFRMDRGEPALNQAIPDDPRDTTTPEAFARIIHRLILGDALRPDAAATLTDLMLHNTTGDQRIRAGAPDRWLIADRTGTGDYGTANDIAVLWPTNDAPIVLAIMTSRQQQGDEPSDELIAQAAQQALKQLHR